MSSGAEPPIRRLVLDTSACGGHLLTFDRHFERVSGLTVTVLAQS